MEQLNSESGKYAAMSRCYIRKADEYLQEGDREQASEKGWGAVVEAVKSVAAERGWNHQSDRLLNDVVFLLSVEWGRPEGADFVRGDGKAADQCLRRFYGTG